MVTSDITSLAMEISIHQVNINHQNHKKALFFCHGGLMTQLEMK